MIVCLLFSCICSAAQDKLYVVNGYDLGYVDMADYTYHKIATLPFSFTDLANTPDGKFYGLDDASVYEINVTDGTCTLVPAGTHPTFSYGNSMVSDRDGNLFVAGSADYLHKINLKTGEITQVGLMGYAPGGDLCFSDGKLYMVTHDSELLEIILDATRSSILSTRLIGKLGVKGQVYSIGANQYGICYLISTIGELAIIDLEDAATYVISNDIKGGMKEVNGIAIIGEGRNDKDIEICGNGIDDDRNGFIDDNDMACRMKRGICTGDSKEIFREDFGAGGGYGAPVPGLGSGAYTFSSTAPLQEGQYTIVDNPRTAAGNDTWKQMTDYSGAPGGRMMVINGSFFPGEIYRKRIDGLCDQQQYALSVKACSVIAPELSCGENTTPIPSRIRFRIEDAAGNVLGQLSERYIPVDDHPNGSWKDYGLIFTLPAGITAIQLVLLNDAPGGCGNDMAIDNIALSACQAAQPIKINNGNDVTVCAGGSATFAVDMTGVVINNPLFSWQQYDAANARWVEVNTTATPSWTLANIAPAAAGQYRVQARENTGAACYRQSVSPPVLLTVKAIPNIQVTPSIRVCNGQPLQLSATNADGYTLIWRDAKGNTYNGASPVVASAATAQYAGVYTVEATSADHCTATASTTVTVAATAEPGRLSAPSLACINEAVVLQLSGQSDGAINWSLTGNPVTQGTGTPLTATWATPGRYTIQYSISSSCGPANGVAADIEIGPLPGVALPADTVVCSGTQLLLQPRYSNDVTGFSWEGGAFSSTPGKVVHAAGTYTVVVQNRYGCRASDAVTVQYGACGCEVYLPNAFTPNGDGRNDVFRPVVHCTLRVFRFSIYNRWGQLIYSTNKPGDGWNGSWHNSGSRLAETGTYVWVLEYEGGEQAGLVRSSGTVTLLQ